MISLRASTFATDTSNHLILKGRAHMLRASLSRMACLLDGHLWQARDKLGRIISVVAVQHCKPVMMYAVFR